MKNEFEELFDDANEESINIDLLIPSGRLSKPKILMKQYLISAAILASHLNIDCNMFLKLSMCAFMHYENKKEEEE